MSMWEDFVEYVEGQDSDREIDHHGWYACAIGQFYHWYRDEIDFEYEMDTIIADFEEEHGYIMESLNHGHGPIELEDEIDTYGQLATYLVVHAGRTNDEWVDELHNGEAA